MAPPRRPGYWIWFALITAALTVLVLWLAADSGGLPDSHAGGARLVYGIGLAALIAAGLIHSRRIGLKGAVGAALAWVAIGLLLVLGYSFRHDVRAAWERIAGELAPDRIAAQGRSLSVRQSADGHFYIRAEANGVPVRFLVDTGAGATVLDPRDAARIGFDLDRLAYTQTFRTANGLVQAAPVTLESLAIGPVQFAQLRASVNRAPIGTSLLGVATLERFRAWRVEGGVLTLEY